MARQEAGIYGKMGAKKLRKSGLKTLKTGLKSVKIALVSVKTGLVLVEIFRAPAMGLAAILHGASIVRIHAVRPAVEAALITDGVLAAG